MKNLFFTLAFMLVGTLAFANEKTNSNSKEFESFTMVNEQVTNLIDYNAKEILVDCTMTITDNQTGKSYTITIKGKSCGELIKEIME